MTINPVSKEYVKEHYGKDIEAIGRPLAIDLILLPNRHIFNKLTQNKDDRDFINNLCDDTFNPFDIALCRKEDHKPITTSERNLLVTTLAYYEAHKQVYTSLTAPPHENEQE